MEFSKAHGTGNDFVVIDDPNGELDLDPALVTAICARATGVGADAVIRLAPSDEHDVYMDYRNADGSTAEMCGNGVRVVADQWHRMGRANDDAVIVDTPAGPHHVTRIQVDGRTELQVEMTGADEVHAMPLDFDGRHVGGQFTRAPNPHLVLLVDDVDVPLLDRLGPGLQTHADFPDGVNVELAARQASADGTHALRVHERGVGQTLSCGTASVATTAVLANAGLVDDDGRVALRHRGGIHRMQWQGSGRPVLLTAPATHVFTGNLDEKWLSGLR